MRHSSATLRHLSARSGNARPSQPRHGTHPDREAVVFPPTLSSHPFPFHIALAAYVFIRGLIVFVVCRYPIVYTQAIDNDIGASHVPSW